MLRGKFSVPGHLRPVILKPVGRIFEISDSKPIRAKRGKCGKSLSPQKNKGLRRFRRASARKTRKMRTRKRGKCGKCGWLALMWLALGDSHQWNDSSFGPTVRVTGQKKKVRVIQPGRPSESKPNCTEKEPEWGFRFGYRNLLKLRSLHSSFPFFLSDNSTWGQWTQMLQMLWSLG